LVWEIPGGRAGRGSEPSGGLNPLRRLGGVDPSGNRNPPRILKSELLVPSHRNVLVKKNKLI